MERNQLCHQLHQGLGVHSREVRRDSHRLHQVPDKLEDGSCRVPLKHPLLKKEAHPHEAQPQERIRPDGLRQGVLHQGAGGRGCLREHLLGEPLLLLRSGELSLPLRRGGSRRGRVRLRNHQGVQPPEEAEDSGSPRTRRYLIRRAHPLRPRERLRRPGDPN